MVPAAFANFFVASTGAGAALVGLLFVALSIAPEQTVLEGASLEKRALATSAFTALLNAFFISLAALIPSSNLGWTALVLSLVALTGLLMGTYGLGLVHAWGLIGGRRYGLLSWLSPLRDASGPEARKSETGQPQQDKSSEGKEGT